jgi:hypothetical protein
VAELHYSMIEDSCAVKQHDEDKILLTGSDATLNEFIERSGKCLVVDWRSDEGDLTEALAEMLPTGWLSHQWSDAEDDLYITYRGARHKVGLTLSPRDRYVWLRRMNEVMAGDYELRAFRHTLGMTPTASCWLDATGGLLLMQRFRSK